MNRLVDSCNKDGVQLKNNNLWRFINKKDSKAIDEGVADWLLLRPSETFLSFSHSNKPSIQEQLEDVYLDLKKKLTIKEDPAKYLYLDYKIALEELNTKKENPLIYFEAREYPHIGLFYEFDQSEDVKLLEVNTVLTELAVFENIDNPKKIKIKK